MIKTLEYAGGVLRLIDQTRLPSVEEYVECRDYKSAIHAIKIMVVRGAPAIGVSGGYACALAARELAAGAPASFGNALNKAFDEIANARPTAVNLSWAVNRIAKKIGPLDGGKPADIARAVEAEAVKIHTEDLEINKRMGNIGAEIIDSGDTILTHCNAGALATAGDYGTALGVIKAAHVMGKKISVYADETRPFLQGARLTAWELIKENIPSKLITDNMAGHFMRKGVIKKVVVGADRIAANGDTANKIGTYGVAVLAKENGIPFYVAAPLSTIDLNIPSGEHIPIEERTPLEVTHIGDKRVAPENVVVENPAFDVTPNKYIAGIITEKGIARAPFDVSLKKLFSA